MVKLSSKKIKVSNKDNIFCDYEHLANTRPGPGQFNPHVLFKYLNNFKDNYKKPKLPQTWDNPKEMKKITAAKEKKIGKSPFPDIGSYNPFPVTYDTFGLGFFKIEKNKGGDKGMKSKLFGTSERFHDVKKAKVKRIIVPGPGMYDMIANWSGKTTARTKEVLKKDWMKNITKGTP